VIVDIDCFVSGQLESTSDFVEELFMTQGNDIDFVEAEMVDDSIDSVGVTSDDGSACIATGNRLVEDSLSTMRRSTGDAMVDATSNDEVDGDGDDEADEDDEESMWTPTQVSKESLRSIISDLQQQSGGHEQLGLQGCCRGCCASFS